MLCRRTTMMLSNGRGVCRTPSAKRKLLVGSDGITVEAFLSWRVEHWIGGRRQNRDSTGRIRTGIEVAVNRAGYPFSALQISYVVREPALR
jgi:hypothetical protein